MRTPVTLKIKFKSANLDQFIERYSVDVSRGGIFIRTKEPLPVGTQLKFEFQLQDAQPLISGEGTVVWIREHDPTRTGVAPGMGVRFDKLAPQSQQVLDKILTEKQRLDNAGFEGKFDAATRAVAADKVARGEIDARARPSRVQSERTPLPDPSPFGGESRPGEDLSGFGSHESTKVMLNDQAEALAQKMREHDEGRLPPSSAPKPMAAPRVHRPTPTPVLAPRPKSAPPVAERKSDGLPSASSVVGNKQQPMAAKHEPGGLTVTLGAPPPKPAEPAPEEQPRLVAQPFGSTDEQPQRVDPFPRADEPAEEPAPARRDTIAMNSDANEKIKAALAAAESVQNGSTNGTSAEGGKKTEWFSDAQERGDTGARPVQVAARQAVSLPPQKETTSRMDATERRGSAGAWVALLLLAAAGGGGYLWWRSNQTPVTPPVAVTPRPVPAPVAAPTPKATPGLSVPVGSTPAGALVELDGKAIGPAPTRLEGLDPEKTYSVKLTLKGHKTFETRLTPKAGAELAATLAALPRWVAVQSTPAGADVFVDGKRAGATPTTLKAVDFAKTHKIDIKKPGFEGQTREVQPSDAGEDKADHSELALAVELVKTEKPVVVRKPRKPREKPVEKPAVEAAGGEPTEKPVEEKPVEKPVEEKPVEKPAVEKPVEKPPEDLKTPDWMKK